MAISFGVGIILVFQNYFFKQKPTIEDKAPPIDEQPVNESSSNS
jgi:hypothetical protein